MSYRQIYIRKAEKLSLRHHSLIIKKENEEFAIPLEDIASLLLEDHQTVITAALLAALSDYYITLIICDEKHLPITQTLPMNMHYKQLKVFYDQLGVKKPFNSQLWNRLIHYKIMNQKAVIDSTVKNEDASIKLKQCIKDLQSGDKTNREAIAAKIFFEAMYGNVFSRKRKSEDAVNAALNYGYSILLSAFNREIVLNGYLTQLGLFHDNMFNQFNLASDLMEPFRPLVDRMVLQMTLVEFEHLQKMELVNLLNKEVIINDRCEFISNAIKIYCKSVFDALNENDVSLIKFYEVI